MGFTVFSAFTCAWFALVLFVCRHAIDTLLFGDIKLANPKLLPDPELQRVREFQRRRDEAVRCLRNALFCSIGFVTFMHLYSSKYNEYAAIREAALLHGPPYSCGMDSPEWHELRIGQRIIYSISPDTIEQSCVAWLERVNLTIFPNWPNPVVIVVDATLLVPMHIVERVLDNIGLGLSQLLRHFAWFTQSMLVVALPVCCFILYQVARMLASRRDDARLDELRRIRHHYTISSMAQTPLLSSRNMLIRESTSDDDDNASMNTSDLE